MRQNKIKILNFITILFTKILLVNSSRYLSKDAL